MAASTASPGRKPHSISALAIMPADMEMITLLVAITNNMTIRGGIKEIAVVSMM